MQFYFINYTDNWGISEGHCYPETVSVSESLLLHKDTPALASLCCFCLNSLLQTDLNWGINKNNNNETIFHPQA